MFIYVDDAPTSRGNYGSFGLNEGILTKFEFNPNGGRDNQELPCIDVEIKVGENYYRNRIFEPKRFYKKGQEVTQGQEGFEEAKKSAYEDVIKYVVHILKVFNDEDVIKAALNKGYKTFTEWAKAVTGLVPRNFDKHPLHVFLQYQPKIASGKNQTYLELPKNQWYGNWLCAKLDGEWKEQKTAKGLQYINQKGDIHPIMKDEYFLKSKVSIKQTATESSSTVISNPDSIVTNLWD